LTRYRKAQIQERSREAQRLDKILQDAGIKLSSVATDVLGASGRAMLATLVAGGNDPEALAELARGRLRTKIPALRAALTGRFSTHHALMAGEILAKLDYLDEAIGRLSAEIETRDRPHSPAGLSCSTRSPASTGAPARVCWPRAGADMSVVPSAAHLASWAGRCPGQHESAGKRGSGNTRNGPRWLRLHLHDASLAATNRFGNIRTAIVS
jgi:transposase